MDVKDPQDWVVIAALPAVKNGLGKLLSLLMGLLLVANGSQGKIDTFSSHVMVSRPSFFFCGRVIG